MAHLFIADAGKNRKQVIRYVNRHVPIQTNRYIYSYTPLKVKLFSWY